MGVFSDISYPISVIVFGDFRTHRTFWRTFRGILSVTLISNASIFSGFRLRDFGSGGGSDFSVTITRTRDFTGLNASTDV